jgi:hypothetical protein
MTKFRIVYQHTSIEAPEGVFLIGRSSECNLVLDDPSVSRIHAAIIRDKGRLYIQDKGSRNGARVNEKPVNEKMELEDGDNIVIGHQNILILAHDRISDAENTVGLKACKSCGSWVPTNQSTCTHCGTKRAPLAPQKGMSTNLNPEAESSSDTRNGIHGHQSVMLMVDLAHKAIRVSKFDDAERLLDSVISRVQTRLKNGDHVSDDRFIAIVKAIVELGAASKSARQISILFRFHRKVGKLMSRELVEDLYETVRFTGYTVCREFDRYLSVLDSNENTFDAGEKFVYRRLKGLAQICS